jgi:N-acetylmuramoyl-L-alanine amidase
MSRVSYPMFLFKVIFKCFILILLMFNFQASISAQPVAKRKIATIVIDAGHGGKDPGTLWKRVHEKDIVLSIALKLGNYIKHSFPEIKVIYTRKTDVFIELNDRALIANKNQADLFISIHANSNEKSTTANGTETYVMGLTKSEENLSVAKKENAVILLENDYSSKYDGYDPNSTKSFIIFSFLQNAFLDQSMNFASCVQKQFKAAGRGDRGCKQAGFLVLWKTTMPSVLIETGFVSNEEDRKLLTSEEGQNLEAISIYKAFCNYRSNIERHSITGINYRVKDTMPAVSIPPVADTTIRAVTDTTADNSVEGEVSFLIQISSSRRPLPLNSQKFKGLKNVEEIKSGDNFKYVVGRKQSYNEVLEYSNAVKNYFPDAFIIAMKNGKIIPLKEARKEIKD